VREADKDRFLASLFAPADKRRHLLAVYAFNAEVARVREVAREVLPGEMRLQWWHDALTGSGHGEVRAHPVAAALLETITSLRLPRDPFLALIDARRFDIYDDPMPSLVELEAYVRLTSSALVEIATLILLGDRDPGIGDATREAGLAYGLTGLLRAFPGHAARGQVFLPLDVLGRHEVRREEILAGETSPRLIAVLAEMRRHAREHVAIFDDVRANILPAAAPAFLPVALVLPALRRLAKSAEEPFAPAELPQWRRQWILWRAARQGYPAR
jgi:phytoene synthase